MYKQLLYSTVFGLIISFSQAQARLVHHWRLDENVDAGVTVADSPASIGQALAERLGVC